MATVRTVQEAINRAYGKINISAVGEAIPAEDQAIAVDCFQDMIAEWAIDNLLIPFSTLENFTLVVGQVSYTIGETAGADLDTVRPERINSAFIRVDNQDYPVDIIGERAYNAISLKATAGRPDNLFYNPTAPNGTAKVYPTPNAAEVLYFTGEKPITEPTTVTADMFVTLGYPRNYHNVIIYNLAIELAPEYGKTPAESVIVKAEIGKRKLISLNAARTHEPARSELANSRRRDYDRVLY